ncbi:MAG TPA: DUF5655 domain-containing protein [Vicinamibacterales bacterium]|nr:DUF5655 domain-containing protein [Vicinamibacterales bacterium]
MAGHECYHCKQWIDEGEPHDCWTTTEAALTADLPEDLREAWERLRETAVDFGEQRIYASHSSIMFSRRVCYCFVRPKRTYLEVCIFLGRELRTPQVRKVYASSTRNKFAHMLRVVHRDEVEPPLTDWMAEAYEFSLARPARPAAKRKPTRASATKRKRATAARKKAAKKTTGRARKSR